MLTAVEPVSIFSLCQSSCGFSFVAVVDCDEIFNGLRNNLGVIFSKDDTRELLKYLDEDESGDIDEHEFC